MPRSSLRLCARCKRMVRGRCPHCTRTTRSESDGRRDHSAARGYGHHWRTHTRLDFLQENPLCCLCGALAEVPDHYPETRASLVARGVPDPDAFHRMRPLCLSCHARYGLR